MTSLRRLLLTVPVLLLALSACGTSHPATTPATSGTATAPAAGGAPAATATLAIKNFAFSPATLTVAPGATVTVHNEDQAAHTVTASGTKSFDTGDIAGGATRTFTAPTKPGRYPYICSIHQYMTGTLVVS